MKKQWKYLIPLSFFICVAMFLSCNKTNDIERYYNEHGVSLKRIAGDLEHVRNKYNLDLGYIDYQSDLGYYHINLFTKDGHTIGCNLRAKTYSVYDTTDVFDTTLAKDSTLINVLKLCNQINMHSIKLERAEVGVFFILAPAMKSTNPDTYSGVLISNKVQEPNARVIKKLEEKIYVYETSKG